jgi:hypothetical protein
MLISHEMATVSGHQVQYVSWHTAYLAEPVASVACSASCQDCLEDIGILTVVMPKLKLCKIERQILLTNVVIAPHNTAFQQAPETLDIVRMYFATHIFALTVAYRFVRDAARLEQPIAGVFVSCYQINLVVNGFVDKAIQRRGIGILNHLADYVSLPADRTDNGCFSAHPYLVLLFVPMAVLIFSAKRGFIYLNDAHQLREILILHCGTNPSAYIPRGLVGTSTHHPVNLKGRHTLLALAHQVDNLEPRPQWIVRVLKDRLSYYREPITVFLTVTTLPVESLFQCIDFLIAATRALHAIRPTHIAQQRFAGIVCCVIAFYIGQSQGRLSGKWCARLHVKNNRRFLGLCQVRYNRPFLIACRKVPLYR